MYAVRSSLRRHQTTTAPASWGVSRRGAWVVLSVLALLSVWQATALVMGANAQRILEREVALRSSRVDSLTVASSNAQNLRHVEARAAELHFVRDGQVETITALDLAPRVSSR